MSRIKPVRFGEVERFDRHHIAILDFIKSSPQSTENQVVKAMEEQKVCSKMTTLKKLDELIEKQEISDLLKEGENGFHRFIINKKNEYNQISEKISELEAILTPMEQLENFMKKRRSQNYPLDKEVDESYTLLEQYCSQLLNMMVVSLLNMTKNVVRSEKDAQILYSKSIELLFKLGRITGSPTKLNSLISDLEFRIIKSRLHSSKDVRKSENKDPYDSIRTEPVKTELDISRKQFQLLRILNKNLTDVKRLVNE